MKKIVLSCLVILCSFFINSKLAFSEVFKGFTQWNNPDPQTGDPGYYSCPGQTLKCLEKDGDHWTVYGHNGQVLVDGIRTGEIHIKNIITGEVTPGDETVLPEDSDDLIFILYEE